MKKLLTILFILSSVFAIGQTTHTSAYDQYPSQQNPSLGTRFFVHGYLRGDTLIIVDKDTTGWQPSRDGVITYHNSSLFRWDSTYSIWLQIAGGGGGDTVHQSLNFDALFLSNSPYYNTDFPVSLSLDTVNYIATKSDITNGFPDTTTDTTNGAYRWNAELIIYGDFTPVDGHQYLIWNTVTGTDYVGHEKQIMKVIGGVPNYYDAALGDLILIGDDTTATTTYTLIPSPGWVKGKVFVNTGINYTPTTLDISTNGSHQLRFGTNGKIRGFFAANGNFYLNSFKGADSATQYLRANPDGRISLGDFIPAIIYVDSVSNNAGGDSLIVYKNGTRYAYVYPSGGGSGGISELGNSPYGLIKDNDSTYEVDTTLLQTKLRSNTTTDSLGAIIDTKISANQAITVTATGDATGVSSASGTAPSLPLTLATVNSNVGSFTNANITVNAKGLITAASNGSGGGGGTTYDSTITSTGGQTVFTYSNTAPTSATNIIMFYNGSALKKTYYTITGTTTTIITFTDGFLAGDEIRLHATQ